MNFEDKTNGQSPIETVFRLLSVRYKSTILWALRDGKLRYNELQERIPQASSKMLAEQLMEVVNLENYYRL